MNFILEEFMDELMHYGTKRHSGRYPWGSGETPYQHSGDFKSRVDELKKAGKSEKEIAEEMGLNNTSELRTLISIAKNERRALQVEQAKSLRSRGYSLNEIAREMGFNNDSSVRALLNASSEAKMNEAQKTADALKKIIDEKGMIDVGAGSERELGISKERLNQALYILNCEGYPIYGVGVPQATNPGKQTNLKVICPPGTEHKEVYDYENIHSLNDYTSRDGGESFETFKYPASLDSKRLMINYAEDGGLQKDGVIELRRGVKDLDLGESHYAQVRILVDGTHYLKGMAVYADDLPDGIDVRFNTNKTSDKPMKEVLKKIKNDPENPFGTLIKANGQSEYEDENGQKHLSLINKKSDEGDWDNWDDKLPSQFLSKQPEALIKKQLKLTYEDKMSEYDEICSLTNPTVKKKLLEGFASDCDAAAVHLKAAALPRQKYKVILPMTSISDNEVYAPTYENGETVALIRYPHGGTFEIPILKVNNKLAEGKKVLGANAKDAVGISSKVAERLSGADFDGDTVMVIPCNSSTSKVHIMSTPQLEGLKDFDPKFKYGGKKEGTFQQMKNTQTEMGKISNLITDMTLKGATNDELARAVRHSMVVIDAEKHKLDYKQSERDNRIAELKKLYQGRTDENGNYHEGASTLISRAKSETQVTKRKGSGKIDPLTGEVSYKEVIEEYTDPKTGKIKMRTQKSTQMAETKDAYTLVSDYRSKAELAYAEYANQMKALANSARKEMKSAGKIEYSASAKATYQKEVDSLKSKLNLALMNAPRERQAQLIANSAVKSMKQEYPDMTKEEKKKKAQQALAFARVKVGAKRTPIEVTDREWEAIQSGAITENVLSQMLNHVDMDKLKERATPRTRTAMSEAKINKMKAMSNSGYTTNEIAKALGVSSSTVNKYL